jgi:hypothetical protein
MDQITAAGGETAFDALLAPSRMGACADSVLITLGLIARRGIRRGNVLEL